MIPDSVKAYKAKNTVQYFRCVKKKINFVLTL